MIGCLSILDTGLSVHICFYSCGTWLKIVDWTPGLPQFFWQKTKARPVYASIQSKYIFHTADTVTVDPWSTTLTLIVFVPPGIQNLQQSYSGTSKPQDQYWNKVQLVTLRNKEGRTTQFIWFKATMCKVIVSFKLFSCFYVQEKETVLVKICTVCVAFSLYSIWGVVC